MEQGLRRWPRRVKLSALALALVACALLGAIGARAMGFGPIRDSDLAYRTRATPPSRMFQDHLTTTPIGTSSATATPAILPEGAITETPTGTSTVTVLATGTPDPGVEVSVISVKVEKKGAKPDWALSRASLKKVRSKSTVMLAMYYTTTATGPKDVVGDEWTVTKNRKVVFRKSKRHHLGKPTSGLYRDYVRFKPRKAGTYVYTGRVTIRGVSDAGRTSVKSIKRRKRGR